MEWVVFSGLLVLDSAVCVVGSDSWRGWWGCRPGSAAVFTVVFRVAGSAGSGTAGVRRWWLVGPMRVVLHDRCG